MTRAEEFRNRPENEHDESGAQALRDTAVTQTIAK